MQNLLIELDDGYLLEFNEESKVSEIVQNNKIYENIKTDIQDGAETTRGQMESNKNKKKTHGEKEIQYYMKMPNFQKK